MNMKRTRTDTKPWYREPWPWVAIAIPGAAVIMGIVTLFIAISNPDPLVVDESTYKQIRSELKAQEEPAGQVTEGEREDGAG